MTQELETKQICHCGEPLIQQPGIAQTPTALAKAKGTHVVWQHWYRCANGHTQGLVDVAPIHDQGN